MPKKVRGARTWLFFRCFVNCNSLRVIGLGQFCVSIMGGDAQTWAEGKEPVGRKEMQRRGVMLEELLQQRREVGLGLRWEPALGREANL